MDALLDHGNRWPRVLASAAVLISLAALLPAQTSSKSRGPRALAVVELSGSKKDSAKLYPVTLFERGNYFDASIYNVNPVPMAVDAGTVYEVERSGEPVGLVTIDRALQQNGAWIATGHLQPETGGENKAAKSPGAAGSGDDERPVLKRGQNSAASPENPPTTASNTTAAPSPPPPDTDVNRPALRRRKPNAQPPGEEPAPSPSRAAAKPANPAVPVPVTVTKTPPELLVAVSDAMPSEQHPYNFLWKPEEQQRLTGQMKALVLRAASNYARARQLVLSGSDWEEVGVRAFDLFYDNDAEIVILARRRARPASARSAAEVEIYGTVVALLNSSGELQQLFSEVTDDRHLDVAGRLELIDAVDADGDGRGELLFQRRGAGTSRFELYRVTRDQLYKLFESK